MRRLGASLVLLAAVVGGWAVADDTSPSTTIPPPTQTTTTAGTSPANLVGHWLVLLQLTFAGQDQKVATPVFWDVTAGADGAQTLTVRMVKLPVAIRTRLDQAISAKQQFEPTAEELRTVAAEWDRLAPDDSVHYTTITTELASPDGYTDEMKSDEHAKNARWVVRQDRQFHPSSAPAIREVHLLAVEAEDASGFRGHFQGMTLAAAPFPIPIPLAGEFRAYRLSATAPAGGGSWLADLFSGCHRR